MPVPSKQKFDQVLNYMENIGKSLYVTIHKMGYTLEDLRGLIMHLYNVDYCDGDFISNYDSEVGRSTSLFRFLKRCFNEEHIEKGHDDKGSPINYGETVYEAEDLIDILEMPLDRVPLNINGTELRRGIALWRLSNNK